MKDIHASATPLGGEEYSMMQTPFTPKMSFQASITPLGMPSLALPTPRRLSDSREFYTSKTFFTGSPRGFKDRVKW